MALPPRTRRTIPSPRRDRSTALTTRARASAPMFCECCVGTTEMRDLLVERSPDLRQRGALDEDERGQVASAGLGDQAVGDRQHLVDPRRSSEASLGAERRRQGHRRLDRDEAGPDVEAVGQRLFRDRTGACGISRGEPCLRECLSEPGLDASVAVFAAREGVLERFDGVGGVPIEHELPAETSVCECTRATHPADRSSARRARWRPARSRAHRRETQGRRAVRWPTPRPRGHRRGERRRGALDQLTRLLERAVQQLDLRQRSPARWRMR